MKMPEFNTNDSLGVVKALSWFNINSNKKESRSYLLDFLLEMNLKSQLANIKKIPEEQVSVTYGYIAKLLTEGYELPEKESNSFQGHIMKLSDIGSKIELPEPEKNGTKPIKEKPWNFYNDVNSYLGPVEHEIDVFIRNDYRSDFSMYNFLKALPLMANKSPKISEIGNIYKKQLDEISGAYDKSDGDLVEAYGYIPRRGLKRYVNFMQSIVDDCEKYADYLKPKRKPRKSKTPTRMKMVKNFKYKESDEDLGIRSDDPVGIPGSKQIWIFNTKNKLLFHYDAEDVKTGLSISGSSLKGYNKETSRCKKIKKPFDDIQKLMQCSRSDVDTVFDKISGKEYPNGQRVNNDMVIFRIIK